MKIKNISDILNSEKERLKHNASIDNDLINLILYYILKKYSLLINNINHQWNYLQRNYYFISQIEKFSDMLDSFNELGISTLDFLKILDNSKLNTVRKYADLETEYEYLIYVLIIDSRSNSITKLNKLKRLYNKDSSENEDLLEKWRTNFNLTRYYNINNNYKDIQCLSATTIPRYNTNKAMQPSDSILNSLISKIKFTNGPNKNNNLNSY